MKKLQKLWFDAIDWMRTEDARMVANVCLIVAAILFIVSMVTSCGSPSVDETWLYKTL